MVLTLGYVDMLQGNQVLC